MLPAEGELRAVPYRYYTALCCVSHLSEQVEAAIVSPRLLAAIQFTGRFTTCPSRKVNASAKQAAREDDQN